MTRSCFQSVNPIFGALVMSGLLITPLLTGEGLQGQDSPAREAYLRLVATHFQLPAGEVEHLAETGTSIEELPVALRISQVAGISPTVLIAVRRGGQSWSGVARRYALGAEIFHLMIPENQVDDQVRRAHGLFQDTPEARWNTIQLTDEETVILANLQVLTRGLGATPGRVLEARAEAGSFAGALRILARG